MCMCGGDEPLPNWACGSGRKLGAFPECTAVLRVHLRGSSGLLSKHPSQLKPPCTFYSKSGTKPSNDIFTLFHPLPLFLSCLICQHAHIRDPRFPGRCSSCSC